ncbi:MAG TPA: DUF1415 domain-containing protein [Burkholderiaceae bacterium]|nr:DUF1415 domain-containing protein [Burkholderiaceae bacterium]
MKPSTSAPPPQAEALIRHTRAWVERAVVGLNLCPFAKAPLVKGLVHFSVCESDDPRVLLEVLCAEMTALVQADPQQRETTLLIHPNVLEDFDAFNDFLDAADAALEELGLEGVLQVASFHPRYRFADATADAIGNATNRAPYPTLHLLREASVERAVAAFPAAETIFEANVATLEALGAAGWAALQAQCRADAAGAGPGVSPGPPPACASRPV